MENIKITINDKKWFYSYLNTEQEVEEVCSYLRKTSQTIKIEKIETNNFWSYRVFLDGLDLSVNGGGFNGKVLLYHVRNYQRFLSIMQTEEYKKWLSNYDLFQEITTYVNARKK